MKTYPVAKIPILQNIQPARTNSYIIILRTAQLYYDQEPVIFLCNTSPSCRTYINTQNQRHFFHNMQLAADELFLLEDRFLIHVVTLATE